MTVGAKWCKPCSKELVAWDTKVAPVFTKLKWFAVDIDEKADDGKAFHSGLGIKNLSPVYTGPNNIGNLGSVMPSSYVVDPNGIIRYERCGFEEQAVDREIKDMSAALSKLVLHFFCQRSTRPPPAARHTARSSSAASGPRARARGDRRCTRSRAPVPSTCTRRRRDSG